MIQAAGLGEPRDARTGSIRKGCQAPFGKVPGALCLPSCIAEGLACQLRWSQLGSAAFVGVLRSRFEGDFLKTSSFLSLIFFIAMNLTFFSSRAVADPALLQRYHAIAPKLTMALLTCPERLWPGLDWTKSNILLINNGGESLVWRGETGQVETLPEAEIPSRSRASVFNFMTWRGQRSISINGGLVKAFETENMLLRVIIHEGFHYIGQQNWRRATGSARGTAYPAQWEPRLYRRLIFDALRAYYDSKGADTQSLDRAAGWYQRWAQEYPAEVLANTDGYEGTARFVELIGFAITEVGCGASEDALSAQLESLLQMKGKNQVFGGALSGQMFSLDGEGYDIGGLSALILKLVDKNMLWSKDAPDNVTPLHALLSPRTPEAATLPGDLKKQFSEAGQRINSDLDQMFGPELALYPDSAFVRIGFPPSAGSGSFSPKGFFLPVAYPELTVLPLARDLTFKGASWTMTAVAPKVLFNVNDAPCASSFVALAPKTAVDASGTYLQASGAGLIGDVRGKSITDKNGVAWFCGEP